MKKINLKNSKVQKLIKKYQNLESWAFSNSLYVHPDYINAVKNRNKIIAVTSSVGTILTLVILKIIFLIIR